MNGKTRAEQVYNELRLDIVEGRLEPGEKLGFAQLNKSYGASVGVLREALTRLAAEGLAVNNAQQGFKVLSLSLEDLDDLTKTRCHIESMILKDSIANGDLSWEANVVAAHHKLERTVQKPADGEGLVSPEWAKAHHEFHMALVAAAKSRRLKEIAANLRTAAEIYRRWSMPFEKVKRNVEAEHKGLMDAALARDGDLAAHLLTEHLQFTAELIVTGTADAKTGSRK